MQDLMIADNNTKNLEIYNIILNKYFRLYDDERHIHGTWYEPTGDIEVRGDIPNVLREKLIKRKEKLDKQFQEEKHKNELEKNDELKSIYEQITL